MRQLAVILTTFAALSLLPTQVAVAADAGAVTGVSAGTADPGVLPVTVPGPATSPADAAAWTYKAFRAGEYWHVAGMVLLALVGLLRRYAGKIPKVGPWFTKTDDGGTIFALLVSAGTVLGVGLVAGDGISWRLAETALLYGGCATAAWSVMWKRLLQPLLARVF